MVCILRSRFLLVLTASSWLIQVVAASGVRHGRIERAENEEVQDQVVNRNRKALLHSDHHREVQERRAPLNAMARYEIVVDPYQPFDLGMRFSKITFADQAVDTSRLPFTYLDYPISDETAQWLSQSQCPSVTTPDCQECAGIDFHQLVRDIGGPPTHPDFSGNAPFWDELLEVVERQQQRIDNVTTTSVMPLPLIWEGYTLEQVSDAVHDEYPGLHHQALIEYLLKDGARVDNSTLPQMCAVEFLRGPVMLSHLNTWAIANVGPVNFGVKYFVGRARPEEVAYMISTREMSNAPLELMQHIEAGSLSTPESFTAYPEGSPKHPSWPAMHSAASVGSTWLAVVMNLTDEQWCQAKLVDYGVAYARTVAGVHYASDNIAGLALGQRLIAEKLPAYLESMYGSDRTAVEQKVQQVLFDWSTFHETDCYLNHMT